MDLTVEFEGLYLFVRPESRRDPLSVLLPRADYVGQQHLDAGGPCDGGDAKTHWAYLLARDEEVKAFGGDLVENVDGRVQARLQGARLTFDCDFSPRPLKLKDLDGMVELGEFTSGLALAGNPDLAASFELAHGEFNTTPSDTKGRPWVFPDDLKPGHGYQPPQLAKKVAWRCATNEAVIRLEQGDADGYIQLDDSRPGATVIIGNECEEDPGQWSSIPPPACVNAGSTPCGDVDFKWIYRLFEPESGESWPQFLDGRCLPVPMLDPAPAGTVITMTASSPFCIGALWGGG